MPTHPVAIIVGNEQVGVNEVLMEYCDDAVRVPSTGWIESLNVAQATAVILGEVWRNHGGPLGSKNILHLSAGCVCLHVRVHAYIVLFDWCEHLDIETAHNNSAAKWREKSKENARQVIATDDDEDKDGDDIDDDEQVDDGDGKRGHNNIDLEKKDVDLVKVLRKRKKLKKSSIFPNTYTLLCTQRSSTCIYARMRTHRHLCSACATLTRKGKRRKMHEP